MPKCRDCDTEVKREGDLCAPCISFEDMYGDDDRDTCILCNKPLGADDWGEACRSCEFLENECGMRPDGQCSMAGSEDCDWRCPRR